MTPSKTHASWLRRGIGPSAVRVDSKGTPAEPRSIEDSALYGLVLFVGLALVVFSLTAHPPRWGAAPTLGALAAVLAARCLVVRFVLGLADKRSAPGKRRTIRPS